MNRKKIFVLDDDEYVLDFILAALPSSEFEVLTAGNGMQAVEIISKEKPDLLLLDLMIPKMNALQICAELDRNGQTRMIPRMIMTGSVRGELKERAESSGVQVIMKKPFTARELLENIKNLTSGDDRTVEPTGQEG